ncbi:acetoin utilization AcuB family protein [Pseudalkalibacillus salsuginis]|uniref:acetoin utilization AcuB family protein n=1 Tax=Pseudalkalibacillus salsuginis TaxID=2910972 RepID=UPI001F21713B|nr:acetoin utilization AcuB family protein [Pseudalkalibacillus salsuginis]MCF6408796.1 acetoin utilization AcuB family protein [Pseudalkalibacillus salsuginis]
MKVEAMMKTEVISIRKNVSIEEAKKLMESHRIRHLPIVDEQKNLVGIVSDRDLVLDRIPNQKSPSDIEVQSVMVKEVITCHPYDFVEELLSIFYEERIGCIPVVKDNEIVGMITERDMLYTLIQLTGAHQPSSQFEVKVENVSGRLADVTAVIRNHNVNINSVLVYPGETDVTKVLVLRVQTMNPIPIINHLKSEGYNVLWPDTSGEFV